MKIQNGKAEDDKFWDFPAADKTVAHKFVVLLDLLAKRAANGRKEGSSARDVC